MSDAGFGRPELLATLVLVPLAVLAWWRGARAVRRAGQRVSRSRPCGTALATGMVLGVVAALALAAAARPQWGASEAQVRRAGVDVMVVFDVSRSMAARDVPPSRMEAARSAVANSLARLARDRAGLVVFAGSAHLRFPLTSDLNAAAQVVRSLEPGSVFVTGGTRSSAGLDLALAELRRAESTSSLVIFVTDGDDLGPNPEVTLEALRDSGARLLVVGVGTPQGSTIPVLDRSAGIYVDLADADGAPIISRLNEPFLRGAAEAAGGRYVALDARMLPGIVRAEAAALQEREFARSTERFPTERFHWLAWPALALVVLASLAEWRPRRLRPAAALATTVMLALLLASCATRAYELNEDALAAFDEGRGAEAVELFYEARAERPDDPVLSLNLARALHAEGRHDEAIQAARRAAGSPLVPVRTAALASLGHHWFARGDLEESLDAFKRALLIAPQDDVVRRDYEVVYALLHPPEPPPGEPGQGDDANGGDGDPGDANGDDGGPAPGDEGDPGQDGDGAQDGPGAEAPGASPRPTSVDELEQILAGLDAEIARLQHEAGDQVTAEEALRILDLIAERSRLAALRSLLERSSGATDY